MCSTIFTCLLSGTWFWSEVQFQIIVVVSKLFLCCDVIFAEVLRLVVVLKANEYFCVITFLSFLDIKAEAWYDTCKDFVTCYCVLKHMFLSDYLAWFFFF